MNSTMYIFWIADRKGVVGKRLVESLRTMRGDLLCEYVDLWMDLGVSNNLHSAINIANKEEGQSPKPRTPSLGEEEKNKSKKDQRSTPLFCPDPDSTRYVVLLQRLSRVLVPSIQVSTFQHLYVLFQTSKNKHLTSHTVHVQKTLPGAHTPHG